MAAAAGATAVPCPQGAGHGWHTCLALKFAANELFHAVARQVIDQLARRMLHRISRDRIQWTADLAIARQLGTANHVDDNATRIGRILYRHAQLKLDRHSPKTLTLDSEEDHLVVALPGHVVRGTDMNVVVGHGLGQYALHRRSLRFAFGAQPRMVEHVEKIGVAASVELVGVLELDAAVSEDLHQGAM